MRESENVVPQKFFSNVTVVSDLTTATNWDMALVASANSLYQLDSTGGSTVWGVGTGAGGAADGVNIVSMATATSGGGTGGTTYSNSTGTIGLYAGSNVTLSQSNNAIVIFGPSPAAASLAISAASASSVNTGITFAQSNNVGISYNGTQVWANAWHQFSDSATSTNVSRVAFSNSNGISFGISTGTSFNATITASIPQHSLHFSDANGVIFGSSTAGSSTTITASVTNAGGGGGAILVSAGTTSNTSVASLVFSNSNQVSFGLYSSSRITASIPLHSIYFDTAGASGNVSFATSTAGSTTTVYASAAGGGGTGAADGVNVVSMGVGASASGTTLGTRTSFSTGTMGLFAGSNVYLSQNSNSIVIIAPGQQIGAGSQTRSTTGPINFVNSNSVSFGMSGSSQITASLYGNSISFGTGGNITFGTATTTNATGATTTLTASGPAGGIGTVAFSAQGGSSAYTTLSFRNMNGLSWTNSGGQVALGSLALNLFAVSNTTQSVSGSVNHSLVSFAGAGDVSVGVTNGSVVISAPAQTNQSMGIYASSNTTGDATSKTIDARSLTIVGAGINYLGWTNGSVVFSATQSNQALSGSNGSFTFQTATFGNLNGLSFYTSNGSMVGSYTVPVAITGISIEAGTDIRHSDYFSFADSNNVSFGLNGNTITASIPAYSMVFQNSNNATFGTSTNGSTTSVTLSAPLNVSAGTTSNNLTRLSFSNANGISFGLGTGTITATYNFNLSAGTTSNNLSKLTVADAQNVQWGLDASTLTAQLKYVSSYENVPGLYASQTYTMVSDTSQAVAFYLPQPGSFSFMRVPVLMTTNSTTRTITAASLSASADLYSTWNAVVYSLGVGASSRSLQSVAKGQGLWTWRQSVSFAADGTSGSYSQHLSGQAEGAGLSRTVNYTSANANSMFFKTDTMATNFSSVRYIDIPFANSLSAGAYWMVFGVHTASATNSTGISVATQCNVRFSVGYGNSQANLSVGVMGSTNLSTGGMGAGSFTSNGGAVTTASIDLSCITTNASGVRPYFQLLRSA